MKPDHVCVNHSTVEAVSFCHHCQDWLCSRCVVEGREHYYCRKTECIEALNREEALAQGKCPYCGKVVRAGAALCGPCGKPLRELTDEEKAEDLITVATYNHSMEAHLARTKLESEGIEAYVADEHMVSINPAYNIPFGGVKLKIKNTDLNKAISVLGFDNLLEYKDSAGDLNEKSSKIVMVKCSNCGEDNEIKTKTKFCGSCGKHL